jgi:hypothetical protein
VCVRNRSFDFASGSCSPLALWSPYLYVFRDAKGSAFRLERRKPLGSFGNYPVLVRVAGSYVACDERGKKILTEYSDALGFTVDCLAPTQ